MYASGKKGSSGFKSYCKAQQNAAATANASTWTKMNMEGVDYDNLNEVDFTTNKRWTATEDGVYHITAVGTIKGLPNTAGIGCLVKVYKNGTPVVSGGWNEVSSSSAAMTAGSNYTTAINDTALDLVAGDYIETYIWQNHSAGLLIEGPNFCIIERIA